MNSRSKNKHDKQTARMRGIEWRIRISPALGTSLFCLSVCAVCVCSVETKGGEGLTEAQKQAFKDKVKDEE